MAKIVFTNGNYMVGIKSSERCPICGSKDGRCSILFSSEGEVIYYACRNVSSSDGMTSNNLYKHFAKNTDVNSETIKRLRDITVTENEITPEIIKIRNKVYRKIRELVKNYEGCYLYKNDLNDLLQRGLTREQIASMGFFSFPNADKKVWRKGKNYQCKLSTAIAQDLYDEFEDDLLLVAGFKKVTGDKGDYITYTSYCFDNTKKSFAPITGYFIPYHNKEGLIEAMQYRLTIPMYDEKGKKLRYFWFSSDNASSGSPLDFFRAKTLKKFKDRNNNLRKVILVTEGALKGKIACEILGVNGIFMAGVGTVNSVIEEIKKLQQNTEQQLYIISALDMDKYDNYFVSKSDNKKVYPILQAEGKLISELKRIGVSCSILEWNDYKGVDEALQNNQQRIWKSV
jgi:hypothetical protein